MFQLNASVFIRASFSEREIHGRKVSGVVEIGYLESIQAYS